MHRNGFSLVELSIVLVILGLLTGGILAGQSLIRAAELRKLTTSLARYHTASMTFRDKYFATPGDMPNAYSFWNTDTRCGANQVVSVADPSGCNGNGDGQVVYTIGESFKAWMHMQMAGLIEGSYTGTFTSATDYRPGENVPRGVMGSGRFLFYYYGPAARAYTTGSVLTTSTNNIYHDGSHTIEDVWNIDTKLDDGKPGLGAIFASINCNAATNQTDTDLATYDLINSKNTCGSVNYRMK